MVEIIGVRFNNGGKMYYFDPKGQILKIGTDVLVETARGVEMGHVVVANTEVDESEIVAPLKSIIRVADKDDYRQRKENKEKEKDAFIIANEQIREHKIPMKLVDVEYTFDRSKILFYFTADGRVDFRELVKSLAGIFHTRIELRQIGVRDEARQLGSFGICGRYVCCGTFLDDFKPVSIRMAKEQGLSLNPTKISGVCGRLMCCLQYEQNAYEDILKRMPPKGAVAETPDGKGVIVDVATLKEEVKVKFDDGDVVRFGTYKVSDIKFKNNRKNKNDEVFDKDSHKDVDEDTLKNADEAAVMAADIIDEEAEALIAYESQSDTDDKADTANSGNSGNSGSSDDSLVYKENGFNKKDSGSEAENSSSNNGEKKEYPQKPRDKKRYNNRDKRDRRDKRDNSGNNKKAENKRNGKKNGEDKGFDKQKKFKGERSQKGDKNFKSGKRGGDFKKSDKFDGNKKPNINQKNSAPSGQADNPKAD